MKIRYVLFFLLIAAALVGVAFAPTPATPVKENAPVPQAVVVVQATTVPQPTKSPEPKSEDLSAIEAAYKTSTHANNYGLGRGPNTYCARCHSPRNWDPKAVAGPAPNCMACKFPFDKEVRKPPPNTNTFIEEKDWKNIGCDVCHQVTNNVVDAKPVIWNQATGKYDTVSSNTALCENCHADSLGGSKHKIALGGPAHTTQIGLTKARPQQCTDCHNAHSQKASCTNCHTSLSQAAGHDAAHANITCIGCHDAAGLKTLPNPDGKWVTFISSSSPAGGPPSLSEYASHVLQKAVACTRCHYDNNPQKLRSLVTPTAARPPASPSAGAAAATPTIAK